MCSSRCSQYHWDISHNFCPKLKSLKLLCYIHETKRKSSIVLSWECKLLFLEKCTEFGDSVVVMGQGEVTRCRKKWSFGSHFMQSLKNTSWMKLNNKVYLGINKRQGGHVIPKPMRGTVTAVLLLLDTSQKTWPKTSFFNCTKKEIQSSKFLSLIQHNCFFNEAAQYACWVSHLWWAKVG